MMNNNNMMPGNQNSMLGGNTNGNTMMVEEVMDYRTYCCASAKASAKTELV